MSMDDAFPPFEPDGPKNERENGDEATRRRLREVPLRFVLPNIITVLAICAGLSAVRMAFEQRFDAAIGLILLAAVLDGLDGRMARLVKGTSRFGAEMDSLADAVNFGVVPALVLYIFVLDEAAQFGWIAALLYVIACTLRLARFNAMLDDPNRPAWKKDFFVGMPAPAGALTAMLPLVTRPSLWALQRTARLWALVARYSLRFAPRHRRARGLRGCHVGADVADDDAAALRLFRQVSRQDVRGIGALHRRGEQGEEHLPRLAVIPILGSDLAHRCRSLLHGAGDPARFTT